MNTKVFGMWTDEPRADVPASGFSVGRRGTLECASLTRKVSGVYYERNAPSTRKSVPHTHGSLEWTGGALERHWGTSVQDRVGTGVKLVIFDNFTTLSDSLGDENSARAMALTLMLKLKLKQARIAAIQCGQIPGAAG
jgi:hypothetical protein